jgi:hypothetical protein
MEHIAVVERRDIALGESPDAVAAALAHGDASVAVLSGSEHDDAARRIDVVFAEAATVDAFAATAKHAANVTHLQRGRLIADTGSVAERGTIYFTIGFAVPAEELDDFDAWYAQEHVPMLFGIEGWLRIRRYEMTAGGSPANAGWNRYAFHELRNLNTWNAPERLATRSTPWRSRLAAKDWYQAHDRGLFHAR